MHAQERRMENMVYRQSVWVLCDEDDMLHGSHIEPIAIALIAPTDYIQVRFLCIYILPSSFISH